MLTKYAVDVSYKNGEHKSFTGRNLYKLLEMVREDTVTVGTPKGLARGKFMSPCVHVEGVRISRLRWSFSMRAWKLEGGTLLGAMMSKEAPIMFVEGMLQW